MDPVRIVSKPSKKTAPRVGRGGVSTGSNRVTPLDKRFMQRALTLAQRAQGHTSPNPMVGAVLVRAGRVLGEGYHHAAGLPHAEVEAFQDAERRGHPVRGATLYVTLEPCCTHGRTPPCVAAILSAGIAKVFVAAVDPNPSHSGRGIDQLRQAGVKVTTGLLAREASQLNRAFNHWIVNRSPFVTVKAAMTLDGKIATATGESKWITGEKSRTFAMGLRGQVGAIVVGVNTVLQDDPQLTFRSTSRPNPATHSERIRLRRVILDSKARTPIRARILEKFPGHETVVVTTSAAPALRVQRLSQRATVWRCPGRGRQVSIAWLLERLGMESVTHVMVEGGGEVNSSFLLGGHAHEVAFFYAPKILGGAASKRGVGGKGANDLRSAVHLENPVWRRLGKDLLVVAGVRSASAECATIQDVRSDGKTTAG